MKRKNIILVVALVLGTSSVLLLIIQFKWCNNPLKRHGVNIQWAWYGATSTVPTLHVWWEGAGIRVECPPIFGGLENPRLRFEDMDGDDIEEIVFESGSTQKIASFKPGSPKSPPSFTILKQ